MGYRKLEGVTGGYKGLQGVTGCYKGLRGLQGITKGYRGLEVLHRVKMVTGFSERQNQHVL